MFVPRFPKFYIMYKRNTIEESYKTLVEISLSSFNLRLEKFKYQFLSYDERLKAYKFILPNSDNIDLPFYLIMRGV